MSFEIFLHRFRGGETAPFPRKVAIDIMDRGASRPSDLYSVAYPDGGSELFFGGRTGDAIDGIVLSRVRGDTVCERLLELAATTESLIFWPSLDIKFGVTDLAHMAHLPADLRDNHYIALIRTVAELWSAIDAELEPSPGAT